MLRMLVFALLACGFLVPAQADELRLNQVGYLPTEPKRAVLLAQNRSMPPDTHFSVRHRDGRAVFRGRIGDPGAGWNEAYPATYQLDFTALADAGQYTIVVDDAGAVASPPFRIGSASTLYAPLLSNALSFYAAQHDGAEVDRKILDRRPSHLTDRSAQAYLPPRFTQGQVVRLQPAGGRHDVAGGWFDAGDYLKFVETASYVDLVLYLTARDYPSLPPALRSGIAAEARFGSDWLLKMWDDRTRTLFYQVGTGQGRRGAFLGDHDLWRLPQRDDAFDVQPGDAKYYLKYRPAFRAAAPRSPVSPNLAGRLAASFALCGMAAESGDHRKDCARAADRVFALADTEPKELLSTSPHGYYPENVWQDDLELGAVELHFLAKAQGDTEKSRTFLRKAAEWARAYLDSRFGGGDTLNLYDVAPLAHLELIRALDEAGDPQDLAVTRDELESELRWLLGRYAGKAENDPFGSGWPYGPAGYDFAAHSLGLAVTGLLFEARTGDRRFSDFARRQRDVMLGSNAWGTSFIVGAGAVFPNCLHHQIANLAGSLDGTRPVLVGAVVNGPATASDFRDSGRLENQRKCPADGGNPFAPFDGQRGRYVDNTGAWASVEPAIDYTVLSVLLFAILMQ